MPSWDGSMTDPTEIEHTATENQAGLPLLGSQR
jgi:hypothetical protein